MANVSYKELGLVNTKEMFAKAFKGGYAIPAYNFNNMEQMQAIVQAAVETKSPVILQVSKGAREYANHTYLIKENIDPTLFFKERMIQELLGHDSINATQIYTHVTDKAMKEIYTKSHPRAKKFR